MTFTVSAIADAQSQTEVGYAADMSLTPGIDKRPLFEKLLVEGSVGASTSHHDTRIADISLRIGYRFTTRFHAASPRTSLRSGISRPKIRGSSKPFHLENIPGTSSGSSYRIVSNA